jgi:hypothetical protein
VLRGLRRPELQYQVYDDLSEFVARLDMAYPALKRAMEYDGRQMGRRRKIGRGMWRSADMM